MCLSGRVQSTRYRYQNNSRPFQITYDNEKITLEIVFHMEITFKTIQSIYGHTSGPVWPNFIAAQHTSGISALYKANYVEIHLKRSRIAYCIQIKLQ